MQRNPLTLIACFLCFANLALAGSGQASSPPQSRKSPARTAAKPAEPPLPAVDLPTEPGEYAVIYTSMGNIVCRLFPQEAPKTVANFKGLAMGTKPWTDPKTGKLRHTALYSGTTFHRVIPDFMIQGGDPRGDGTGEPGFKIEDEINPSRSFDHPGILAMANSGPNTNGCQFFITVGAAQHLDGHYSVFGEVVSGQDVANAISQVPRDEGNDKPKNPVIITAIRVRNVAVVGDPATKR